jgi:hypothetical protein
MRCENAPGEVAELTTAMRIVFLASSPASLLLQQALE